MTRQMLQIILSVKMDAPVNNTLPSNTTFQITDKRAIPVRFFFHLKKDEIRKQSLELKHTVIQLKLM